MLKTFEVVHREIVKCSQAINTQEMNENCFIEVLNLEAGVMK